MEEKKVKEVASKLVDVISPLNIFPTHDAKEFIKALVELIADEVEERLKKCLVDEGSDESFCNKRN